MGKTKMKRFQLKPKNPTGIPSTKELEAIEMLTQSNEITGAIDSILEKLKSRKAEDRECAAINLAKRAVEKEFLRCLIDDRVLRAAAPLLLDRNLAVRHAIAGSLRNMAVCGDYLVSQSMVEQDVMTSLVTLFREYKDPWSPVETTENTIDSKTQIFLEACNLLWTLCENCEVAVSIFNENGLIHILLPCLNVEVYGLQISIAVAHCIHTVGENNSEVTEVIKQPAVAEQLKILMTLPFTDPDYILLGTLAAGIKLNLFSGKLKDCMSDVTTPIVGVIFTSFEKPVTSYLDLLKERIMILQAEKANPYHDEKDVENKESSVDKTADQLTHLLSSKQISVEILGNIFDDNDDNNEEWEDISSSDASDIITEESGMDIDETDINRNEIELGLPVELYKNMISENVFQKVIQQMITPSDEVVCVLQHDPKGQDCLKKIETLSSTALLCLNNIIQTGDVKDLGGPQKLGELWLNLANKLFKETNLNNADQVEPITRLMSAIVRKIAEAKCLSHFNHMTEPDLELLINICHQSEDNRTKVHIIQIIGTIGCILGNLESANSSHLIKLIGSVLLDICSRNMNDTWILAEALDVIFDVFAEDHLDSIAVEISLVDKLQIFLPVLKARIKQQRKNFGDHLPVIMTARDNLLRFIKYKNTFHKK